MRHLVKMYEKPSISEFKHALVDGDVDRMIIQKALNVATKKNVVVHCIDTDVFIAFLHHFDISGNSIVMTKNKDFALLKKLYLLQMMTWDNVYWSVMPYLDVTLCQLPLVWESWRLLTNLRNLLTGEVLQKSSMYKCRYWVTFFLHFLDF